MNDKRSSLPCPMIISKRPSSRTELAHHAHEQSQRGYRRDADRRQQIIDEPPERIGRGKPPKGAEKVK